MKRISLNLSNDLHDWPFTGWCILKTFNLFRIQNGWKIEPPSRHDGWKMILSSAALDHYHNQQALRESEKFMQLHLHDLHIFAEKLH